MQQSTIRVLHQRSKLTQGRQKVVVALGVSDTLFLQLCTWLHLQLERLNCEYAKIVTGI